MLRKIIIGTVYSIIAFCVISYISVMASLFKTVGEPTHKPETNIGFPYKYYYQFWVTGSDTPNSGWLFKNFILDCLITWAIVLALHFLFTKNKKV